MKTKYLFFAFVVLSLTNCARYTSTSTKLVDDISTCGLVVLLSDRSEAAEKLRAAGMSDRAEIVLEHDREKNMKIIDLFSNSCSHSTVYFTYKKNVSDINNGVKSGIFLAKDLTISSQSIDCDNFLYVENGYIDKENEIDRADDWIVKDKDLKAVERPFPWRVNYPIDCLGKGQPTEIDCLCYKISKYIQQSE